MDIMRINKEIDRKYSKYQIKATELKNTGQVTQKYNRGGSTTD